MKILALGPNSTKFCIHNLLATRRLEMQKLTTKNGGGGQKIKIGIIYGTYILARIFIFDPPPFWVVSFCISSLLVAHRLYIQNLVQFAPRARIYIFFELERTQTN